jgi:Zn-dependent M28 family amino/carboxypeptidase
VIRRISALVIWAVACAPEAPHIADPRAAGELAQEIMKDKLTADVETLATEHARDQKLSCEGFAVMDRYPACELSRDAAVRTVQQRFSELGLTTHTTVLGEAGDAAHNVIAEQRGSARPNEVLLIGAHLDAFFAGADDNSSGVAALLELARIATQHRFARTLRFVAFDLEERGSLGSLRYVQAGMADDVTAALILECLGFASEAAGSQDSPPGLPLGDTGDSLVVVGNADSASYVQRVLAVNHALGLAKLRGIVAGGDGAFPLTGALTRSDNGPFWLHAIPAVLFTDTADFRNDDYHRAGDLPETLDPEFLTAATRAVAASMAVFGELQP